MPSQPNSCTARTPLNLRVQAAAGMLRPPMPLADAPELPARKAPRREQLLAPTELIPIDFDLIKYEPNAEELSAEEERAVSGGMGVVACVVDERGWV